VPVKGTRTVSFLGKQMSESAEAAVVVPPGEFRFDVRFPQAAEPMRQASR